MTENVNVYVILLFLVLSEDRKCVDYQSFPGLRKQLLLWRLPARQPPRKLVYLVVTTFPCPFGKLDVALFSLAAKEIYFLCPLFLAVSHHNKAISLVVYSPQGHSVSWQSVFIPIEPSKQEQPSSLISKCIILKFLKFRGCGLLYLNPGFRFTNVWAMQ